MDFTTPITAGPASASSKKKERMCKPDVPKLVSATSSISAASPYSCDEVQNDRMEREQEKSLSLLWSLDSYKMNENTGKYPSFSSKVLTVGCMIAMLIFSEQIMRQILLSFKDFHPLFENETNRLMLARHLGVDVLSCGMCALLGMMASRICMDLFLPLLPSSYKKENGMKAWNPAGYDQRLFTYHPEAYRLSMVFFTYQVKNLYDTLVWNDGPEFVFHHIFSMITALAALQGYVCHHYTLFYFGLSEVSTAVLCLLANFDDAHGVPGLGDAFPMTKVIVASAFVTLFIICRCVMWPVATYKLFADITTQLKLHPDDPKTSLSKTWLLFLLFSSSTLTILQVMWLGQIFIIANEELVKLGLL